MKVAETKGIREQLEKAHAWVQKLPEGHPRQAIAEELLAAIDYCNDLIKEA